MVLANIPAAYTNLADGSTLNLGVEALGTADRCLSWVSLRAAPVPKAHLAAARRHVDAATAHVQAAAGGPEPELATGEAALVGALGALEFLVEMAPEQLGRLDPVALHQWLTDARDDVRDAIGGCP